MLFQIKPIIYTRITLRQIRRRLPYIFQLLDDIFFALFARSTEVGSRTLVHAALWGTKEQVNGKYLNKCQVEEVSDYVLSSDGAMVQKKLWVSDLPYSIESIC